MTLRFVRNFGLASLAMVLSAHVGSPDVWYEGNAGPYRVTIQVQMPGVVPGIATIFVRVDGDKPDRVTVVANKFDATAGAPPPEVATPVEGTSDTYSARLWLMAAGSNSITVAVSGRNGSGKTVVPVVNVSLRLIGFGRGLAIGLSAIGLFLFVGMVTIIGAAVREAALPPGESPTAADRSRARLAMTLTSIVLALILFGGWKWWDREHSRATRLLFRPLASSAEVVNGRPTANVVFRITDSAWLHRSDTVPERARRQRIIWSPLVEDHGKLMHLFLIREDLSAFAHLHPTTTDSVAFESNLPSLPPGNYRVFSDVVFESGYAQTMVTTLTLSESPSADPLPDMRTDRDDSWFSGTATDSRSTVLADGSTMTRVGTSAPIVAGREAGLRFQIRNANGTDATLEPYMGMAAHAVVVKDDESVFVHLHPSGTISMASQLTFALRQPGDTVLGKLGKRLTAAEQSSMTSMHPLSSTVSFPYAFPKPGKYRIWVEVRKDGRILTGAFDLAVTSGVKSAD